MESSRYRARAWRAVLEGGLLVVMLVLASWVLGGCRIRTVDKSRVDPAPTLKVPVYDLGGLAQVPLLGGLSSPEEDAGAKPPAPAVVGVVGLGSDQALLRERVVARVSASLDSGATPLQAAMQAAQQIEEQWLARDALALGGNGPGPATARPEEVPVRQRSALVVDEEGRFGAVACLETPHVAVELAHAALQAGAGLLVGEGASGFADELGLPVFDPTLGELPSAAPEDPPLTPGATAIDSPPAEAAAPAASSVARGVPGVQRDAVGDGVTPSPVSPAATADGESPLAESQVSPELGTSPLRSSTPPAPLTRGEPDDADGAPAALAERSESGAQLVVVLVRDRTGALGVAAIALAESWRRPGRVGALATWGATVFAGEGVVAVTLGDEEQLLRRGSARELHARWQRRGATPGVLEAAVDDQPELVAAVLLDEFDQHALSRRDAFAAFASLPQAPSPRPPSAGVPSAVVPSAVVPSAVVPSAVVPSAVVPSAGGPSAGGPSAGGPSAGGPSAGGPSAGARSAAPPLKAAPALSASAERDVSPPRAAPPRVAPQSAPPRPAASPRPTSTATTPDEATP